MINLIKQLINKAFSPNYLIATNTVIGVTSLVGADCIQQFGAHYLSPKPDHNNNNNQKPNLNNYVHDYQRSLGMTAGGLYFGVGGHYWYKFLDKRFPGKSAFSITSKLVCEAAVGPPFVIGCFYLVARVEGKSTKEWYSNLKQNVLYLLATEWGCFLPLQAFNFYFLPPKYRYLYVAVLTILYDNFLSFIFHR